MILFGLLILFIGIIVLIAIRSNITISLFDFAVQNENPFNVCAALNKYLLPELIIHCSLGFLSFLLCMKNSTFWLFLNSLFLFLPACYSYYLHLKSKLKYDARSIFRDLQKLKLESFLRVIIQALCLLITMITLIYNLVN